MFDFDKWLKKLLMLGNVVLLNLDVLLIYL